MTEATHYVITQEPVIANKTKATRISMLYIIENPKFWDNGLETIEPMDSCLDSFFSSLNNEYFPEGYTHLNLFLQSATCSQEYLEEFGLWKHSKLYKSDNWSSSIKNLFLKPKPVNRGYTDIWIRELYDNK